MGTTSRATRDYISAISSRAVIYDGGMGATLEMFDLSPEDYGGLQGKCHEALVLHRPDVIQGVHESMLEAGAEVVETDTFQASRLKLDEWGLGERTLEIDTKAAQIARTAAGEDRVVAGPDRPDRHAARCCSLLLAPNALADRHPWAPAASPARQWTR